MLDLRIWGRSKDDKLFPRRNGICMKPVDWKLALKLFTDNNVVREEQPDAPSLSTPNKPLDTE